MGHDLDDQELEATRSKFYLKSEEQEIIDLKNEIIFLKDVLREKQKEIEEKTTIIMAGAEKVKQLEKEIEELKKENNEIWQHLPRLD